MYGGGAASTTLCLVASSSHPAQAGIQGELVESLCDGGAKPDGIDDDGFPLWTAITRGFTAAVEALARARARIDNVVFAAALGDPDRVREFLGAAGRLRPNGARSAQRVGLHGTVLDPARMLDYALIYACGHGRRAVVEQLLGCGADPSTKEPLFGGDALGFARYHERPEIESVLAAHLESHR
jgi:hypothetical protein